MWVRMWTYPESLAGHAWTASINSIHTPEEDEDLPEELTASGRGTTWLYRKCLADAQRRRNNPEGSIPNVARAWAKLQRAADGSCMLGIDHSWWEQSDPNLLNPLQAPRHQWEDWIFFWDPMCKHRDYEIPLDCGLIILHYWWKQGRQNPMKHFFWPKRYLTLKTLTLTSFPPEGVHVASAPPPPFSAGYYLTIQLMTTICRLLDSYRD